MKFIDDLLNRITMYRLTLAYLLFLHAVALVLALLGVLSYHPISLMVSLLFLIVVCGATNQLFAHVFHVTPNVESVYISAAILGLIIAPARSPEDLWFLGWAGVLAMASKYIVVIHHKHIFNPVAFAVALTYLFLNRPASWWVGNGAMVACVAVGGLLLVRRVGRFDLVLSFFLGIFAMTFFADLQNLANLPADLLRTLMYSSMLFFSCIILTEPLTTPPTRRLRVLYGVLTGVLISPQFHIGSIYLTPELAILFSNVFSHLVSPRVRMVLKLHQKIQVAPDIYDFVFSSSRRLQYVPGQYMEWTLAHKSADSRGNRRYFTLASAPSEEHLRMGIKFYPQPSTFKKALLAMHVGDEIIASQVAGDFTLPVNREQKCVFIAGGVGITPFRSMIQYLVDTCQHRPITMFYANRSIDDVVYKDIFDRAERELGIRTIYAVEKQPETPIDWVGKVGFVDAQLIMDKVPDYRECMFYISGPKGMVDIFTAALHKMEIPLTHIKTDFFPGLS